MNWQEREHWFVDWTGVDEEGFLEHPEEHIVELENGDLAVRNVRSNELHPAGHFSLHGLAELRDRVSLSGCAAPVFEIVVRSSTTSVSAVRSTLLICRPPPGRGVMFQVASISLRRVPSRFTEMNGGHCVHRPLTTRKVGCQCRRLSSHYSSSRCFL